ncbi:unnamed protein product [Rotaria sp. Silwood1]|nr:unnamed protein product [Rotaria sp. Silwood1]
MSDNVVSINENNLIDQCISILKQDGVLAVPTDTIYGLAGLVNNEKAIRKIYEIKGRSFTKPLAISVGYIDDLFIWSKPTLTKDQLSTGDLLPAIRIPNCQFMIELAQRLQEPIALTSANISNEPSSICIDEFKELWSQIDLIIDGGLLSSNDRRGSTIIDLSEKGYFHIQRQGIDCERIIKYFKRILSIKRKKYRFVM